MNDRSLPKDFTGPVVAMLLILTALGNAKVMFVVGAVGLLVMLLVLPKKFRREGVLITTVGAVVAAVTTLVMLKLSR